MNIAITFRQMEATDAMKGYATDKVAKIQKFLRQPMKGQVTLKRDLLQLPIARLPQAARRLGLRA